MARPRKNNADYFSHDNNMRNNRKIKALRNKFGILGYGTFNMFLETLTESDKFKIQLIKELDWELLSADFGCSSDELHDILNYCVEVELLTENNGIYFCDSLFERLSPLVEKREYFREKYTNKVVSTAEMMVSTDETKVSTAEMPQTKLNKTKLKISKDIEFADANDLIYEPLVGNKSKGAFLNRARAKKGKPPMLKKNPEVMTIIEKYQSQFKYITGKRALVSDADYFHLLSVSKKLSPQDMEKMIIWYVKMENPKFKQHPGLKSIFTQENVIKFNMQ